jgi:HTH-type transcriptional regulator/antitoxin HigA
MEVMLKLFRPVKTEADYKRAMKFIEANLGADPGSEIGRAVEVLALLVEKYEEEKYPIEAPDPVEAIKFRMEQLGLERTDLYKIFGGSGRTSEIMNKKRPLNLRMVKKLKRQLGIPAESLIGG